MKIAIISDTHDHIGNMRAAARHCNENNVEMMIHCGDLISAFMLVEVARFKAVSHLIYGNNAGDQHAIAQACGNRFPGIFHHGVMGEVVAEGLKIAFTHYPDIGHGMALQEKYDVVCFGHNHRFHVGKVGSCLVINPGEMLGKDRQPGFCILDSGTLDVERVEVGEAFPEF